jgi:RNA polymerase sigma factor (sigma-70 family)
VDERDLITRCAHGDHEAWERFLERYGGLIASVAATYRTHRSEQRDLFHYVVSQLWRENAKRLAAWRQEAKFSSFLAVIVSRLCSDFLKGRYHREGERYVTIEKTLYVKAGPVQPGHVSQPREFSIRREQERIIHRVMAELSEADRFLITLFYWQEMRYPEIASLLGISVSKVGKRLCKVRKRLRNKLKASGIMDFSDVGACRHRGH